MSESEVSLVILAPDGKTTDDVVYKEIIRYKKYVFNVRSA